MLQIKFETFYLDEYLNETYKINSYVNIITAITSSSSIAAWALWQEFSFIWGSFIATSQVINALKAYMPYSKRLEILKKYQSELAGLSNKYDYMWFDVQNGKMSETDINKLVFELRTEKDNIENKYLLKHHLPVRENLKSRADSLLEDYIQHYMIVEVV